MFATTGAETSAPFPSSSGLTLRQLIERYENDPARRGLTKKTRQAYGTVFRALRELLGENKRAQDITREDCRRVQEILCSLPPNASKRLPGLTLEQAAATARERGWSPLHHKTATNYLNNLSALFNWAVEEGHGEGPIIHRSVDPNIQRSSLRRCRGRSRKPWRPVLGTLGVVMDWDATKRMRATPNRRHCRVGRR